jgi:adenylosuccinate synthase
MNNSSVDVLLGAQWGDEGKGKIVDVITPEYDVIARFQGGPNAGHTLIFDGRKHVLHTIPSGIFRENTLNLVGNGVVIDPIIFMKEIDALTALGVNVKKNLLISRRAHMILPSHRALDAASEASKGKKKIGSTLKGIGPTYMDKTGRNGFRIGDLERSDMRDRLNDLKNKHVRLLSLYENAADNSDMEAEWMEAATRIKELTFVDSEHFVNEQLRNGKRILAEGAQGTLLDIDFGTYPFVTSSNTITAGACTGLGVAPNRIGRVIGIFKAYCTRVGSGPFPTELSDEIGERMQQQGHEFGSTTGRARRCGWLDLPALRYACMINGVTELAMMKADVLSGFETVKVCTHYELNGKDYADLPYDPEGASAVYDEFSGWGDISGGDIPSELSSYIEMIESTVGVPVSMVSYGPDRKELTLREAVVG